MFGTYRQFLVRLLSLLRGGVPIREALTSLAASAGGRSIPARLCALVGDGASLGEAMEALAPRVPAEHAALVAAGEASGRLIDVIDRILADIDAARETRSAFLQQAAYPVFVLVLALFVAPTTLWLATGRSVFNLPLLQAAIVLAVLLGLLVWRGPAWFPSESWLRLRVERGLLALPLVGHLVRCAVHGRILQVEAMMLEAGLGFGESLPLVRRGVGWDLVRQDLEGVLIDIEGGARASDALRRLRGLPRDVIDSLAAGEEAGRLDEAMRRSGDELRARYLTRLRVTLRVLPIIIYLAAVLIILELGFRVLGPVTLR